MFGSYEKPDERVFTIERGNVYRLREGQFVSVRKSYEKSFGVRSEIGVTVELYRTFVPVNPVTEPLNAEFFFGGVLLIRDRSVITESIITRFV